MAAPALKNVQLYRITCRENKPLLAILALSLSLVLMLYSPIFGPSCIRYGAVTSESKVELIYPRPGGSKDFNLRDDATTSFDGFSFYLMGDTPYRDWQEVRLDQQMFEMKEYVKHNPHHNISFTVHVGDIQKVTNTHCAESAYESTASILKKGPLPTFVIPGDNDWYDCPDRDEGFLLFMKHFGKFETKWHKADYEHLGIQRSEDNSELFVFYKEGILFIGIHLINAPPGQEAAQSWDARMNMNKEWVAKNVESYFEQYEVRGVIILGHALRSPRTRPFFLSIAEYFVNITAREDLPVLYLHGDGHDWDVDKKLSHQLKWKHYVDIQVDQGGMAPPVIVDIAPQVQGQLKGLNAINQMQLVVGRGLFRVDRQGGPYEDGQERDDYDEAKHI